MLSEPHSFSFHFLVKNYLIKCQSNQDDFAVLKFYLIGLLGGSAVGAWVSPRLRRDCAVAPS